MNNQTLSDCIKECEKVIKKEYTRPPSWWIVIRTAALKSLEHEQFPEMIEVESSNVRKIGYDEKTKTAYVQFLSGSIYSYKDVPREQFESLKKAASVGSYFYRNFRNKYESKKIK